MEIKQLKYFTEVAARLSFTDAARHLCVAQSTLSQQILQLEEEVGARLLVRNSRSVALTEEGEALLVSARRTLNSVEECRDCVQSVGTLQSGSLSIGCTATFSLLLNETLVEFVRRYPAVSVRIESGTVEELARLLHEGAIDVALSYRPSRECLDLDSHPLFDNHLSVVVSNSHPLASSPGLRLADLGKEVVALPCKGIQARDTLEAVLEQTHRRVAARVEVNGVNMLLSLVASSRYVTFLSQATAKRHPGVVAVPLLEEGTDMHGCYHTLKNAYIKKSAQLFLQIMKETQDVALLTMRL